MHLYHPQARAAERVRDRRDRAVAARRARPAPCIRAGTHATSVVCLHASASSGRQWRALENRLTGRYQVLAPDLYGAGDAPPWPDERELSLADEVALLEPVFEAAGESFHLVGHSYGGAVAARAALANPARIRSLVLIEPVLFGLLLAEDPDQPAAREITAVRDDTSAAAERGALESAAERFADYWMGPGTHPLPGGQPVPGIRPRSGEAAQQGTAQRYDGRTAGRRPHGPHHSSRPGQRGHRGTHRPAR
jgi:pimeloyl-ACP methyl ester carboxylesterase